MKILFLNIYNQRDNNNLNLLHLLVVLFNLNSLVMIKLVSVLLLKDLLVLILFKMLPNVNVNFFKLFIKMILL